MKITIDVNVTIKYAKLLYREHFNYPKTEKVTKSDLAIFFTMLVEGDLESITPNKKDDEDEY